MEKGGPVKTKGVTTTCFEYIFDIICNTIRFYCICCNIGPLDSTMGHTIIGLYHSQRYDGVE